MTTEFLKAPSTIVGARGGTIVERAPLIYGPSSTAELNDGMLPLPEDLRGMSLAYRERFHSDRVLGIVGFSRLAFIYWTAWFLALAALVFRPFIPAGYGIGMGSALSFLLTLSWVYNRSTATPLRFVFFFFGPPITIGLLYLIGYLLEMKTLATVLSLIATVVVYFFHGFKPVAFYREWLYTHPRLKPDTRANPEQIPLRPSWWVLGVVLAIAVFVPYLSPTAALVSILLFCCLVLWRDVSPLAWLRGVVAMIRHLPTYSRWVTNQYLRFMRHDKPSSLTPEGVPTRGEGPTFPQGTPTVRSSPAFAALRDAPHGVSLFQRFRMVFGQYLIYGLGSRDAPGVWIPGQSLRGRDWTLWLLVAPLFLTLMITLDMFCPWDLFLGYMERDWIDADAATVSATPFNWLHVAFQGLSENRIEYIWMFPPALFFAVFIPALVTAAIYRKPLVAAMALRERIEEDAAQGPVAPALLDDDGRPEWQWYVDRLRDSQHIAHDPLGREVREADHLFMGAEPRAQFPVLLHKDVLAEHCYIVGDTGSGKTALGIMPMLLQLLRGHWQPPEPQELPAEGEQPPEVKPSDEHRESPATPAMQRSQRQATDLEHPAEHRDELDMEPGDETAALSEPPPMLILDLKGDNALFQTIKQEVEDRRKAAGITDPADPRYAFRFFTPEKNQASHYFNPFESFQSEARSDIQLCHLMLDALNLNHGEGYGRSYYSRRSRSMLSDALQQNPKSFKELRQALSKIAKRKKHKPPFGDEAPDDSLGIDSVHDAYELLSTIAALSQYDKLDTTTREVSPENAIHMPTLIEHRQVAYFWLPAIQESISVREIGKLALFCLLTAAIDRQRLRRHELRPGEREPRQIYLVIDEFQRLAGENFKILLEQARSFGISAILANQSMADLKTHDIDLRPTVRTNTRSKMYFALSDPDDVRFLSDTSGEELAFPESRSVAYTSSTQGASVTRLYGYTESIKPRLTINDICAVTDQPTEMILQVSRGAGYSQFGGLPIIVRTTYPLNKGVYDTRRDTPWPEPTPETPPNETSPQEVEDRANQEQMQFLLGDFDQAHGRAGTDQADSGPD